MYPADSIYGEPKTVQKPMGKRRSLALKRHGQCIRVAHNDDTLSGSGNGSVEQIPMEHMRKAFGYGQNDSVPFASLRLVDGDDVSKSQSGQWVHALSTSGRCAAPVTRHTIQEHPVC